VVPAVAVAEFSQTTTGCIPSVTWQLTKPQPVVFWRTNQMGRDFGGRFGDATVLFSDAFSESSYDQVEITLDPELQEAWASGKQVVKKGSDVWLVARSVVTNTLPDPAEEKEEWTCEDQARATRHCAVELARINETLKVGFGGVIASLVENSAWSARTYGLINDRTPHRRWTQAAVIDTQQQIRDGFDAIAQRLAQAVKARTGIKVAKLTLPLLPPTPDKYDLPTQFDFPHLIWQASKKVLKP
jgi:hypothetical protein